MLKTKIVEQILTKRRNFQVDGLVANVDEDEMALASKLR